MKSKGLKIVKDIYEKNGNYDITLSKANVILVKNVYVCVCLHVFLCVLTLIRTREQNRELINRILHIKKHNLKIKNPSKYIRIPLKTNQNIFTWCTKRLFQPSTVAKSSNENSFFFLIQQTSTKNCFSAMG